MLKGLVWSLGVYIDTPHIMCVNIMWLTNSTFGLTALLLGYFLG